jgi:hypothetical protein
MKKLTLLAVVAVVAPAANAAVLYDTLLGVYDAGNGNHLGGFGVYGVDYDLQIVDDATFATPVNITAVTVRNLRYGVSASTSGYLRIFADAGGAPGAEITGPNGDLVGVVETGFADPTFGLIGADAKAGGLSYGLGAGTYWFGLQTISTDWNYTANGSYGMGSNQNGRDGSRAGGGYDSTDFFGMGVDTNMKIEGDVIPEPMTMLALGAGLAALAARRRK